MEDASGVTFSLDNEVPPGASQHQKIIVIDGCLAFSGGLDLTTRRWDTAKHEFANRWRIDPDGKSYRPFHDVQAVVDGAAAQALSEIAEGRWRRATGKQIPRCIVQNRAYGRPRSRPTFGMSPSASRVRVPGWRISLKFAR
jgi:phosphatidylserine/phosphatidylglycerophosphate/cardiolipin synthase-like enzyme